MKVAMFNGDKPARPHRVDITRVETTHVTRDGQQYKMFMLDAEDTIDMVVHYPNGEREIVWSLVKEA